MKAFSNSSITGRIGIFLSVVFIYFLLGYTSLFLATVNPNASPIWLCSGFAVGTLLLLGVEFAPAIFIGAFLSNLTIETPIASLFLISFGNMLEAILGAAIVRWTLHQSSLKSHAEVFSVILAAVVPTVVSAVIGVSSLHLFSEKGVSDFFYALFTWWSGDAIGIMVIVPLFVELYLEEKFFPRFTFLRVTAILLMIAIIFACLWAVFFYGINLATCWIISPFFIVVSFFAGPLFGRGLMIAVACFIVLMTYRGASLFEFGDLNLDLLYTQCVLVSYSIAILFYRPFRVQLRNLNGFVLSCMVAWLSLMAVIFAFADFERHYVRSRMDKLAEVAIQSIQKVEQQLGMLVEGASAFVQFRPKLSAQDWRDYINALNFGKKFELARGIGVIYPYGKNEKLSFPIKTINPTYSDQFQDRFVITVVEPMMSNYKALGLDIGSEPTRRNAALKAMTTNVPTATKPIKMTLDALPGFLLFASVYSPIREFIGWTFVPVYFDDFYRTTLDTYGRLLKIKVKIDGEVVYSDLSAASSTRLSSNFILKRSLKLFDCTHQIFFYPTEEFLARNASFTPILGLFLSCFFYFVAGFLLELLTFNQRALEIVQAKTQELDASRMKLIYNSKMASLGEMASGMAHEINNPLSAILVKLEVLKVLLRESKVDNESVWAELEKIKSILGRIGKIVAGLRTFSRSSENDPFEPVRLKDIVTETLDLCTEKLRVQGIKITVDFIPDLLIICKAGQISQVLLNLINNSQDAISNQPAPWIRLSFKAKDGMVQISVSDSGPGIPEQLSGKIMEPFFTTKDPSKGTGLGLSISKGIVEDHQGLLWLDRSAAHTTFVLELPILEQEEIS